jgi:hypothetical protein
MSVPVPVERSAAPGALHFEVAAERIRNHHLPRLGVGLEPGRHAVALVDRKPVQTFELLSRLALAVLQLMPKRSSRRIR